MVLDINQSTGYMCTYVPHGGPNQKWHFDNDGTIRSDTGEVLDVFEARNLEGTSVIAYDKHGGPNQLFKIVYVDKMPFYIQNTETGLVLDVKEPEDLEDPQVIMFTYHGGPNQLWEHKDGMIYSKLNELVLDINEETGKVSLFEPHGGPNQKWHFDEDGTIRSDTDQVLDMAEGAAEEGTPVIAFDKHGGPNQIFKIVTVDA